MFHRTYLKWIGGLFFVLLVTACASAAPGQDQRLGALEEKANTLSDFDVSMAQYIMDTAGFHEMAETLSETKEVDSAYLGTVNQVHKVLANASWPEPLAEQGQAFVALVGDFAAALEADNGEEAADLADQVHEAQHDFSHAIDEWLGASEHEQ
jgi:hypothetical protein